MKQVDDFFIQETGGHAAEMSSSEGSEQKEVFLTDVKVHNLSLISLIHPVTEKALTLVSVVVQAIQSNLFVKRSGSLRQVMILAM